MLRNLIEVHRLSASQAADAINERYGTDFSRNAVIGKAHRAGIKTENRPCHNNAATRRPRAPVNKTAGPMDHFMPKPVIISRDVFVPLAADVVPLHRTLFDNEGCKYPFGDARRSMTFCGHPRLDGSSYCASHHRLAHRVYCETA